ncbi:MAG TPA: DUF1015 family protein [Syntrophales bacterium]|nr:DUF1015 family protein [Syntrophales bacterium]
MARVIPFRAVRPQKKFAGDVASFPYDVLDREEGRAIIRNNPLNFLRVEKSEIDVPDEIRDDDPRVFARARENLRTFMEQGVLFREDRPCFYVYRQKDAVREQCGLVGCVSAAEYESGLIRKHELTRLDKENERVNHIDTAGAQTGLVFLLYRSRQTIDRIVASIAQGPPEYDFNTTDGVSHTAWVVSDGETIETLRREFETVERLYIADGHHRAASASTVARMRREKNPSHTGREEYNFFVAALFPHGQVKILDYNRAVKDLQGLTPAAFLETVRVKFSLSPGFRERSPSRPHQFGMYLGGQWYRLDARPEIYGKADLIGKLDVSILQDHLLGPILGIRDPRTDERIRFVGGIRGMDELEKLVDERGYSVAFSLCPPEISELIAIADAGMIMPPKSTWFEPKLRSGLFVHLID